MRKNFSKSVKLFDIAGQDGLRPVMKCVQFKDGFAYATDGHMLIKAMLQDITNFDPEELAILEGKCISVMFSDGKKPMEDDTKRKQLNEWQDNDNNLND